MSSTPRTRSRGRMVLCRCSTCVLRFPHGNQIPSQDAAQHSQRDQRQRLARDVRLQTEQQLRDELERRDADSLPRRAQEGFNAGRAGRDEGLGLYDGVDDVDAHGSARGTGNGRDNDEHGSSDEDDFEDTDNNEERQILQSAPFWLRLFMILVMWLSCAKGLPRSCADILLSFVVDIIRVGEPASIPRQSATVKKRLGFQPSFTKYVICPNDECQQVTHLGLAPLSCEHCSTDMFEGEGSTTPIRYFQYSSLTAFLQDAFRRRSFESQVNMWRSRRGTGRIEDVSDGLTWRQDGFTENRLNLYLTIGLDWFVAFSSPNTASYTIGVISVRIENLPAHLRNRPEYIHVASVLPGPRQCTEAGLAAAMAPLMDELRQLESGIRIYTPGIALARIMRARVLMAIGDLPARSKLAGFPAHSQGGEWCGHCHANASSWVEALLRNEVHRSRDPEEHRTAAYVVRDTPALRTATLQSKAATWTPLYLLPYWRSVTSVPVDAMHALHLGACKRFYHTTLIQGEMLKLERGQYPVIADVIKSATYPRGTTHIRANFGLKSAGSPTADVWSNFARFFMPAVLASYWAEELDSDGTVTFKTTNANLCQNGRASFSTVVRVQEVLQAAIDLSRVVHLVQKRALSVNDLTDMEQCIARHVQAMATMIHPRWPVPNHHALSHLPDHIRRFGPPRSFWFYSQERLNGFLKKTMHNQRQGGELETTMQTNHALYRTVRQSIKALGSSPPEDAFKRIMESHRVVLDGGEDDDDLEGFAGLNAQPVLGGMKWDAFLEPRYINAIVSIINSTRTALDLVAVPELTWDGHTAATVVGADATFYHDVIVQGVVTTVKAARTNTPVGASYILINSGRDVRLAQLVSALEHAYVQGHTGEVVRQKYVVVDMFRSVEWPATHVLGGQNATRLGYSLYATTDPRRTITPLSNVVDACVTMSAKYITRDEDTLLAARIHP